MPYTRAPPPLVARSFSWAPPGLHLPAPRLSASPHLLWAAQLTVFFGAPACRVFPDHLIITSGSNSSSIAPPPHPLSPHALAVSSPDRPAAVQPVDTCRLSCTDEATPHPHSRPPPRAPRRFEESAGARDRVFNMYQLALTFRCLHPKLAAAQIEWPGGIGPRRGSFAQRRATLGLPPAQGAKSWLVSPGRPQWRLVTLRCHVGEWIDRGPQRSSQSLLRAAGRCAASGQLFRGAAVTAVTSRTAAASF